MPTYLVDGFEVGEDQPWMLSPEVATSVEKPDIHTRTDEKLTGEAAQPCKLFIDAFRPLFEQIDKLSQENIRLRQYCSKIEADAKATRE